MNDDYPDYDWPDEYGDWDFYDDNDPEYYPEENTPVNNHPELKKNINGYHKRTTTLAVYRLRQYELGELLGLVPERDDGLVGVFIDPNTNEVVIQVESTFTTEENS